MKIFLFFLALIILSLPLTARAFDESFSHPYLSQLMVEQWNKQAAKPLSAEEQQQIISGSQDEDKPAARSLNHFYNPLTGEGLSINGLSVGYATIDWAQDKFRQAEPIFGGSFTWQESIDAYKQGDKTKAYYILGHILHLLEDMGMPAHTRNDEHIEGDGLESWVAQQNSQNLKLAINEATIAPADCAHWQACFEKLAFFSNTNFFSNDTMNGDDFAEPWQKMSLGADSYYHVNGEPVAFFDQKNNELVLNAVVYRAYWRQIAPQVIDYGLRVLTLWQEETTGQKANKQTKISGGQISAGGIKIRAGETGLKFNNPPNQSAKAKLNISQPTPTPKPDFPIIDLTKTIPPAFLEKNLVTPPPLPAVNAKVEGEKIITAVEPPAETKVDNPPAQDNLPAGPDNGSPASGGNPPIIDAAPPTASFLNMAKVYAADNFKLMWQGQDDLTPAVALRYDLDYKIGKSEWVNWLVSSSSTEAMFSNALPEESQVAWRVRARDLSDNTSNWQTAEAVVYKADGHNPLLYEGLQHLYHFAECQGGRTADVLGPVLYQYAGWTDGRWGCGIQQGYSDSEVLGVYFPAITTSDVTLALQFKDVSDFSSAYSRNRFMLSNHQGDEILAILPTVIGVRVVVNNHEEPALAAVPQDHNWHNIVVVANASSLLLYIDGSMTNEIFGDFSPAQAIEKIKILGENSPTAFDEIAIWNRSLSSEEIKGYYDVSQPLKVIK